LVAAIVAFISEFVAIRIQQNKRKQERQEPFGEETLGIDDEICNDSANEKRLDDAEAKHQTTIDLIEVCQEICEDLELEAINGRSNIITTIAEVHSHHNDIDQAASRLQVNDDADSAPKTPENKLFGAFPKEAVRNEKQHAAIDLTEICQEICENLE